MPRPGSTIEQGHRNYIRDNYQSRGPQNCCRATGLDIYQVWGLASRMGISTPRGPQRHATRLAESSRRGTPAKRYVASDLEAAIHAWTLAPTEAVE